MPGFAASFALKDTPGETSYQSRVRLESDCEKPGSSQRGLWIVPVRRHQRATARDHDHQCFQGGLSDLTLPGDSAFAGSIYW